MFKWNQTWIQSDPMIPILLDLVWFCNDDDPCDFSVSLHNLTVIDEYALPILPMGATATLDQDNSQEPIISMWRKPQKPQPTDDRT